MKNIRKVLDLITQSVHDVFNTDRNTRGKEKLSLLEQQLRTSQRALSLALADTRRMELELDKAATQMEQWHTKARSSLETGDEEAAREAINSEYTLKKQWQVLNEKKTAQNEKTKTLLRDFNASKEQLDEIRRDFNVASARKEGAFAKRQLARSTVPGSPDSVASDIHEMTREAVRCEAEAEAILSLHPDLRTDSSLEKEFAAIEREQEVDATLETLRNEIHAAGSSSPTQQE